MFFSRTTVVVKSVVEVKELEVVLDGILNVDNDVVAMSDIAKRLKLTPAAAYSACKKLKSTDPRFGITTGLDGERLLFRVPVAGAHMASIVGRLIECVRFKAWRVRNDVRRISAYRACVRHQLHEVRTAMTTIDKRVRSILQRASSDHCKEVRISKAASNCASSL
ncbi:MAG: hypothetical protein IPK83_21235 [Planctomycetes bacterium]|nr:hypothetical protein [Planctomycetota bacterium]